MIEERAVASQPIGFLLVVSIFALFTVIIASAGLFFYKNIINNNIKKMEASLETARNRFEPATITRLQTLDKRLKSSIEILDKHIVVTPIFSVLQEITMKTVRYTKFSYDFGTDKDAKVLVKMSGLAVGYRSIALQSDLFTKKADLIDPVFSNLTLDNNGNVAFDLEFAVKPSLVGYKESLKAAEENALLPETNELNN